MKKGRFLKLSWNRPVFSALPNAAQNNRHSQPGIRVISISEDEVSRNTSYLHDNAGYAAWPGGVEARCNSVNIESIHLEWLTKFRSLSRRKQPRFQATDFLSNGNPAYCQ
jgi:hypothetical protein